MRAASSRYWPTDRPLVAFGDLGVRDLGVNQFDQTEVAGLIEQGGDLAKVG